MPIVQVQRRMMQLGRVRLGEKGKTGEPRKLETFRFTSASRVLLDAVAAQHGGQVTEWDGAPDEGYFQVTTDATSLDIILPPVFSSEDGTPTVPYSQWYELWNAGGCARRCDGVTEMLSNKPCLCSEEKRACQVTTRVSFMLPDIPGLGVWRLDSHGWNAAVELPGTLEVLQLAAAEHRFIPAVLRVEQRTKKVPGEGTRRFVVPVIDLPHVTVKQLASGEVPLALNAPVAPPRRGERPALPAAEPPAEAPEFQGEAEAEWGPTPALPAESVRVTDAVDKLEADLEALLNEIGATDSIGSIAEHRTADGMTVEAHKDWLERCIKAAEQRKSGPAFREPEAVKQQRRTRANA